MATEIGSGSRFQPGYWESCKESLNKIKDPAAKFKAFDELTDRLLTTVSFEFLKGVSKDPAFEKQAQELAKSLGPLQPRVLEDTQELINRCTQLSKETMQDVGGSEEMYALCSSPRSYIENKIFQVLARILLSKNFMYATQKGGSLHPLSEEMWRLQAFNHGSACPCAKTLAGRLA